MSQHGLLTPKEESRSKVVEVKPPAEPQLKPAHRQGLLYDRTLDKYLILLLPVTWFVYYSWRPIFRLRAEMPLQFVDAPAAARPAERAREERLAGRYWELARVLRWRFTQGSPLPAEAPLEFRVDADPETGTSPAPAGAANKPATRRHAGTASSDSGTRYWRKLQAVWLQPDSWEARREWSTVWFTEPLSRFYARFQDYVSNLVRTG